MASRSSSRPVHRADRYLGAAEDALYYGIALLLVTGAFVVLVSSLGRFPELRDRPASEVMLSLLDNLLLVFIFVELLFAVRATLASREIVAEPFLIVGIIASIKEIVVLSVEAAKMVDRGPEFARSIVEVGVLGGLVLLLAAAALLLRLKERAPEEGEGDEAAKGSRGP